MAEAITSAAARAVEELATYTGRLRFASPSSSTPSIRVDEIKEDVKRVSKTLVWIRATLDDAEEMEIRDESVRFWLRELEGVAYDAEDVLDEFIYEVLHLRSMENSGFPPGGHMEEVTDAVVQRLRQTVLQRIEAINLTFDQITKHRAALKFQESCGQRRAGTSVRSPTSSLVQKSFIFGRENDLKAIKKFLLDAESGGTNNISVIAIVGMGGLGKTTLAQLAYNDDSVKRHFDMKLWVYVSANFDLVQLTRTMIESSTQKPCLLTALDPLHIKLKEELDGKRFLLVFDDVWEEEKLSSNWDTLTAPLLDSSKGSKIIITTRSEKVSKIARATSTYHLPCLQDDHCLELFCRWAFEGQDPDSLPTLMTIGKKISMKCKGLPLAAKTLGGLLRSEDDEHAWNNILQCDTWDIGEENGIMPILWLSYQHLPAHLKRCFRYCSVFPKGYEFDKDRLVRMWMAQGYVQMKGRRQMEDIGNEYFDDMLRRSFFQHSQKPEAFLMHDLIHDLANSVSRDECCSVEGDESCSIPRDVRHISTVLCSDPSSKTSQGHIHELGTLRSLLFIHPLFRWTYTMKCLDDLFTRMKHLRVLDLSYIDLTVLPSSIGCLKHLRYLGLRSSGIKQLPKSVGSLYHLQTLDLEFSDIEFLPDSISNLLNLRHIISERRFAYPVGIGRLINLQMMAGFFVSSNHGCAKLGELKDINNIRSLCISGIGCLTDVDEAKKACLERKEQLQALDLKWDYCSPVSDEVLKSLKPNPKLECLNISKFGGRSLPSWLGHPSFSKLAIVELSGCQNWTSLPPLGQLPCLKCLSIESARQVEYIGHEFFSGGFPQLEKLILKEMDNWKSWCGAQEGECRQLRELSIQHCGQLTSLSVNNLDALRDFQTTDCDKLLPSSDFLTQVWQLPFLQNILIRSAGVHIEGVFSCGAIQSLETSLLELENVGQLEAWSTGAQGKFSGIRRLTVSYGDLTSLPLGSLSALQHLEINGCSRFQFSNEDQLPPTLIVLRILLCDNLQSLPLGNLNSLEMLSISYCARLQFSSEDLLPPALRVLRIVGCPFLMKWCQYHRQRLVHIQQLEMEGIDEHVVLRNVLSVQEATDTYLGGLQRLLTLKLVWDRRAAHRSFRDEEPEEVLRNLRPHSNLNVLVIQGYKGSTFASWLGDPSFSNLFSVILLHCSQCEILPPLGQLPTLTELYIRGARMLRCVGKEFFNGSCSTDGRQAFQSLKKLEFSGMPSWEEWVEMEDGSLLSLCELILKDCPMLKALPRLPPSLRKMEVVNCYVITFPLSLDHITSLCTLRISQVPVLRNLPGLPLGLKRLVLERLPALTDLVPPPSLQDLVLQGCSEAMVVTSLSRLTLLTSLRISDFPELRTIPLHNLGVLQELHVSNCPKLVTLDCFYFSPASLEYIEGMQALRSLKHLSISDCPRLHFSANERPPFTLQSMDITNCPFAEPRHFRCWGFRTEANR